MLSHRNPEVDGELVDDAGGLKYETLQTDGRIGYADPKSLHGVIDKKGRLTLAAAEDKSVFPENADKRVPFFVHEGKTGFDIGSLTLNEIAKLFDEKNFRQAEEGQIVAQFLEVASERNIGIDLLQGILGNRPELNQLKIAQVTDEFEEQQITNQEVSSALTIAQLEEEFTEQKDAAGTEEAFMQDERDVVEEAPEEVQHDVDLDDGFWPEIRSAISQVVKQMNDGDVPEDGFKFPAIGVKPSKGNETIVEQGRKVADYFSAAGWIVCRNKQNDLVILHPNVLQPEDAITHPSDVGPENFALAA